MEYNSQVFTEDTSKLCVKSSANDIFGLSFFFSAFQYLFLHCKPAIVLYNKMVHVMQCSSKHVLVLKKGKFKDSDSVIKHMSWAKNIRRNLVLHGNYMVTMVITDPHKYLYTTIILLVFIT